MPAWTRCRRRRPSATRAPPGCSDADSLLRDAVERWVDTLDELTLPEDAQRQLTAGLDAEPWGLRRTIAQDAALVHATSLSGRRAALDQERKGLQERLGEVEAEQAALASGESGEPERPAWAVSSSDDAGAPLWRAVDFAKGVSDAERAGLESALQAAGLLDAWLAADGRLRAADGEVLLAPGPQVEGRRLGELLVRDRACTASTVAG